MEKEQFFVAGINYRKTDTVTRGKFAVNQEQYDLILKKAPGAGIHSLFILSTCNRTEIYGIAQDANSLINLLCSETAGDAVIFRQLCYIHQGNAAIEHLFAVGAGLDSQILGDYEIVGQMKQAVNFAKQRDMINPFLERLFNTVLQSSKAIKNETSLSGGTISVSFAAIQFIKEQVTDIPSKNILLLGTGKIGRNTCKNLVDYLETKNITLINRTAEKAYELAGELGLQYAPYRSVSEEIQKADIIIVATNAELPFITKETVLHGGKKVLVDLSIPNNIDPAVASLPHIKLANVDDLSRINDSTLQKRRAEVPKAWNIIRDHIDEFLDWLILRRHVPVLKAVKQKLEDMHSCTLYSSSTAYPHTGKADKETIQKVVNNVAVKMRQQQQPGCYYIEAINDFMSSAIG